ncbi:UMP kinase [Candidatus Bathyarchaeota archaeon]|nr:MAG: UMP kinase [Candidatus Bathyarchaeota archaeon]
MRVIIRIGGSVVASPLNPKLMTKYAELIRKLKGFGHEVAVVVGGGKVSREFIKAAREVGLTQEEQDEIAISVSRVIAQIIAILIGGREWKSIPTTIQSAIEKFLEHRVVVMGGLKPGMTTDTVALILASKINADLVIKATDQEGIFTQDPKTCPDAKKIDELTFNELKLFLKEKQHKAGIHQIIDPKAAELLQEIKVPMIVLNGYNPENIIKAVKGEKIGTVIHE